MLGLDNNPLYLMRNHFLAMNARKRAFEDANSAEPQRKMIKHSSPQEQKTNQVQLVFGLKLVYIVHLGRIFWSIFGTVGDFFEIKLVRL